MSLGLTQIYWGNGKGKTSSALGLAVRALGNGYSVHLVQFLKNGALTLEQEIPGEIGFLSQSNSFSVKRFGLGEWYQKGKNDLEHKQNCQEALSHLKSCLGKYDIIIADEILYTVQLGLLDESDIISLITTKPQSQELILTGSHIPLPNIFQHADLITEIKNNKHPYEKGIKARKGIEY